MASAPEAPGRDWLPVILEKFDRIRQADVYRGEWSRAYTTAIEALRFRGLPVYSVADVEGLPGLGAKLKKKIDDITKTGTCPACEKAEAEFDLDALAELQQIHGVGPKKALELWRKGFHSIANLKASPAAAAELNDVQKLGLKHVEDAIQRIPRSEMAEHETYLRTALDPRFEVAIVGSYRRQAPDSGDIDVLLTLPEAIPEKEQIALFKQTIALLSDPDIAYISDILSKGDKKVLAYARLSPKHKFRRIDFMRTSRSEFPYAVLYFTGSDLFNIAVRKRAEDLGYTMNEYGMKPIREGVPPVPKMTTEEDIFRFLGMEYVPPERRKGRADIRILGGPAVAVSKQGGSKKKSKSRTRSKSRKRKTAE